MVAQKHENVSIYEMDVINRIGESILSDRLCMILRLLDHIPMPEQPRGKPRLLTRKSWKRSRPSRKNSKTSVPLHIFLQNLPMASRVDALDRKASRNRDCVRGILRVSLTLKWGSEIRGVSWNPLPATLSTHFASIGYVNLTTIVPKRERASFANPFSKLEVVSLLGKGEDPC